MSKFSEYGNKPKNRQTHYLTEGGSGPKALSDVCIAVSESKTFKVQEMYLPVYHTICSVLEDHFFAD
ncbi:MAG: hypothetical protein PHE79_11105 [Eubacteriales bacterium]|nr:hypothetical protein [Eubacteriales bacterium]